MRPGRGHLDVGKGSGHLQRWRDHLHRGRHRQWRSPGGWFSSQLGQLDSVLRSEHNLHDHKFSHPMQSRGVLHNYKTLYANDQDMGNSGVVVTDTLTGGSSQLVAFDKTGDGYVLNPGSLPGYSSSDCTNCKFQGAVTNGGTCNGAGGSNYCDIISSPVYWNSYLFLWPRAEDLDGCYWNSGLFSCQPNTKTYSNDDLEPSGFPGGSLVLSANCTNCTLSGAKRKAYSLLTPPPQSGTTPNFTVDEIWASPIFLGSIFAQPTVVNGSVYVPRYGLGVEVFYPTNQ